MKTFQQFLAEGIDDISINKKEYSWGTLITIRKGIHYTAVLHPEHQKQILSLANGDCEHFTDEQGIKWEVTRNENVITLESGHRILSFDRSEIE